MGMLSCMLCVPNTDYKMYIYKFQLLLFQNWNSSIPSTQSPNTWIYSPTSILNHCPTATTTSLLGADPIYKQRSVGSGLQLPTHAITVNIKLQTLTAVGDTDLKQIIGLNNPKP